jgi:tRNA-guanine family transglycosylase
MRRQTARHFEFGRFKLVSPTFFASYRLGDYPTAGLRLFPWELTGTEALLINAYDLRRPKNRPAINNGWNPATNLDFGKKPILVDSGAYYFLRHEQMGVQATEILELQIKSKADIGVVLDHPFGPKATDKPERLRTTLRNTREMLRQLREFNTTMELMPALHGETGRDAVRFLGRLRALLDAEGVPLRRVGIGSLAPLAQSGNIAPAAEIIQSVRAELPDAHVHCFSMGSALLMLLAFYCGADSVDSQSWILSAAFKYAQLPGHYITRMTRRGYGSEAAF